MCTHSREVLVLFSLQEPDNSAECTIAHLTPDPEDDMLVKGGSLICLCLLLMCVATATVLSQLCISTQALGRR